MKRKPWKVIVSLFLAAAVVYSLGLLSFAATGNPSNVSFENRSDKFIMLPGDNLFPDFDGMMPGNIQRQEINIGNNSNETITLYLRAEPEEPHRFATEEERQKSDELVALLQLELKLAQPDGTSRVIYSGPLSGNLDGAGEPAAGTTMKRITLGDYEPQDQSRLEATLQVPKTLGNEYQNSVARIKWIFSCNITDEIDIPDESIPLDPIPPESSGPSSGGEIDIPDESVPLGPGPGGEIDIPDENIPLGGNPVVTGDSVNIVVPILLVILSATAVVALMVVARKKKSKNGPKA